MKCLLNKRSAHMRVRSDFEVIFGDASISVHHNYSCVRNTTMKWEKRRKKMENAEIGPIHL